MASGDRSSQVSVQATVDLDIHQALADGDPAGLELAFDRYGGLAYGLALRTLGDPGRAEEVVQDVFLSLWRKPAAFDPARGNFRTFLLTMVRNRAIDSQRGRWRRHRDEAELPTELMDFAPASDPAGMVQAKMERAVIREALASLPENQQVVIELAFFQGFTHLEMAERLDLPLGTVKGRLRLGMEKLHTYLLARGVARR